jgi:hypothetical protein
MTTSASLIHLLAVNCGLSVVNLLDFLMDRMMPAGRAELLELYPVLVLLFVLRRRVIAVFAITALQCDYLAHELKPRRPVWLSGEIRL